MSSLLKNIIRFIFFILLQAFVLQKVPSIHQFVKPWLYFLFILWLPFSISRLGLLLIAFVFGLTMDYFTNTPGLHTAPCVLIAYVRPFIINLMLPQEKTELSYAEPSIKSLGFTQYFLYALMLTILHNTYLIFIEWMQFGNFLYFIGKLSATTAVSMLLIFITEMLFPRKAKYRTNAA